MASQVPAKQFSPLKHYPTNEQPKMSRKHHEGILKRMYMPFVRGPEDRHSFPSFEDQDNNAFLKFGASPEEKNYPLAPHRDDVPVTNTITEFMNVGAEADQKMTSSPLLESPKDGKDVPLPQEVVPVPPTRAQTARPLLQLKCQTQDQRWNSTSNPEVSLKAQAAKLANPVRVRPAPPPVEEWYSPHTFIFNVDSDTKVSDPSSEAYRDKLALKYMYATTTQSGYEDVPWDKMLLPRPPLNPTIEAMADCVSQRSTQKRYEKAPDVSQVVGGLWDRFQSRSFNAHHRPINFVSPSSRTEQIPLYTGHVGAENFDDIDNDNVDLILHGRVRIGKPRYTKSSYCNNTPGYTGKVHWSATHPANSNVSPALPSTISRLHGYMVKQGQPTKFPHLGPLSKAVSTSKPYNPFNKEKELHFLH